MNRIKISAFRREVESLLKQLKKDFDSPEVQVTIGAKFQDNEFDWDYQTGNNEYSGAAYLYPHWGVTTLYKRSNCKDLAQDIVVDVLGQMASCGEVATL